MAETFRYTLSKEARLIFSSITQKSAPRGVQNAVPKFSGTFGIEQEDFDAIVKLEVEAIKSEMGEFSGNPAEYYLACTSGESAAKRCLAKAELDARGQSADEAFKIKEKADKRAELYRQFAGILTASSQFDVELAKLDNGKIVDIADTEVAKAQAGKDCFYPGAYVVPAVAFKGFRRKQMDGKDGVTAYLQNVLFVRNGERLGGSGPANSDVFGSFKGYSPEDPTALAPEGDSGSDDQGAAGGF
jgi:hypothetical protein